MNIALTNHADGIGAIGLIVDRARQSLETASSAAEVLDARDQATVAYATVKSATRIAKAKGAADAAIASAHRLQADALDIEAAAKRRLADEWDAAQERGEVSSGGGRPDCVADLNAVPATASDLGLRRDQIHEARQIRDAEQADPGLIRRILDESLARGDEPTRAEMQRSVLAGVAHYGNQRPNRKKKNPHFKDTPGLKLTAVFSGNCRRIADDQENLEIIARFAIERTDLPTVGASLRRELDRALKTLTKLKGLLDEK